MAGENRTRILADLGPPDQTGRHALALSCGVLLSLLMGWGVICSGLMVTVEFAARPFLALFGLTAASVLAIPYLLVILWLDRNEPEPPWLLASAVVWGAIGATSLSLVGNGLVGAVFQGLVNDPELAGQLTASFSAPLIEECSKGFALLVIYALFRRYFDNVLDGIIYGALVGLGFAVFENFIYYMKPDHVVGTLMLVWIRGIVTAPGTHMCFTALVGASVGLFRVYRGGWFRWFLPPLGLALAMFAHFVWNTLTRLFLTDDMLVDLVMSLPLAVVFLQFPFLFLVLVTATMALGHERRLIARYLATEREPVVFARELERLIPARRRTLHGLSLILTMRWSDAWLARTRNRLLVKLAFEKWHMDQEAELGSADAQDHALQVRALRGNLTSLPAPPA